MNSGDVHRHQAHPPLAQHALSGGGHGWYTAAPAPTAPQRTKRLQPHPPHISSNGGGVKSSGAVAPTLLANALHNVQTTHNNCVMSSSMRVQGSAMPVPMHSSQHSGQSSASEVRSKGETVTCAGSSSVTQTRLNLNNMPWHHGAISRERAEQLLSSSQDGVFLIRESTNFPGDHTLSVRFHGHVEHYRIKSAPTAGGVNRLTIDDEEFFLNMFDLIDHYLKDADGLCTRLVRCLPKQPGGAAIPPPPAFLPPPQPPSQPAPFPPSRPPTAHYATDQTDSSGGGVLNSQAFVEAGWLVPECNLEIRENIGKGEFGDVMLGLLGDKKVAVKILKDKEAAGKFLAEASLMTSLRHDNLVRLLGVVFSSNGSICIVTEYMAQGSLLDYLRSRGRHYVTQKHQIHFAYDACCGMEYLEKQLVVHRDLAARNVLIDRDGTAKVADFGLARPIETRSDDPHVQAKLPIKWTAPEALKYNKFSNKSDMWSFGILLWEIYSFGRVPYPRISLNEVVKAVEDGHRMDTPEGCPGEVYELMRDAWHADPAQRPTFHQLRQRLLTLRDTTHHAVK